MQFYQRLAQRANTAIRSLDSIKQPGTQHHNIMLIYSWQYSRTAHLNEICTNEKETCKRKHF